MERTLTAETVKKVGKKIKLQGWVNSIRDHGKITFVDLRDRSGIVQCVGSGLSKLTPESVIEIIGSVVKRQEKLVNPNISTGKIEIQIGNLKILSNAHDLPFDIGKEDLELTLPTLLDYRALTMRHPKQKAVIKVQEIVIDSFRKALKEKGFLEFQAPSIIPVIPEGGAEVFEVKYFDHKAFLAQSPQLYKQIMVGVFERVFSVDKTFRAEPSVTTRHLTEVVSLDAEFGFINSWLDIVEMAEYTIKYILREVEKNCSEELAQWNSNVPKIKDRIPVIKLREAQEIIYKRTGRDNRKEKDLSPDDEREICRWAHEEKGSELIFVSHYPTKARPFYTYPDPESPEYNQGFDLLGRGFEWLTGGRRIESYELLVEHARQWGVSLDKIELYLQAFRYGMPPEGGFAFGAERITQGILKLANIREATPFPRDMERVDIRLSTLSKGSKSSDKNLYEKIVGLLKSAKVDYKHYEHEPVYTSQDSARVRGTTLHQGAKALVLQADKKFILYVLPADLNADLDQLRQFLKVKKLALAFKDTVKAKTGLDVGSIPPFGSVIGLKTYLDSRLSDNEEIAFNAARHDRSIKMKYSDFLKVEKPTIVSFGKEV